MVLISYMFEQTDNSMSSSKHVYAVPDVEDVGQNMWA